MKKNISSYHPALYFLSVQSRCFIRKIRQKIYKKSFAQTKISEKLPYRVYKHQSVLVRTLGDADLSLQYNKITNIRLVIENMNGIIIKPEQTFSFCYLSGKPTKKRGFLKGMLLSNGNAIEGIGGGICQIANLIHWMCLHSPLTVTEHHHSFDPFPDSGRVVPFGCGASIFYNYVDYQFKNETPYTFQLLFWLDKKCLNGDLRISEDLPYKLHIVEKNHKFIKYKDQFYRTNEIWQTKNMKLGSGEIIEEKMLQKNFSLVKYIPLDYVDLSDEEKFNNLRNSEKV